MRPEQLREWLDEIDLPVARAAELLGVDRKTVDRWLAGEREMPPSIDTECHLLSGDVGLYQLRPLKEYADSVHWRASTHQAVLTVRAPSSRVARMLAGRQYGRSARRGADGEESPRNPWLDPELVDAVAVPPSPAMPLDGPFGVIDGPAD